MSTGNNHILASLILTPIAGASGYFFTGDIGIGLMSAAGSITGTLLSPDLDMTSWTISKKVLGPFARLYAAFWLPYSKVIKHRSIWSHGPIIGTLGRLLYILSLVTIVTRCKIWVWMTTWWEYTLAFIVGLMLSDLIHWIMDGW